jgi:DNA-binding CsgD family transcriptional regulator
MAVRGHTNAEIAKALFLSTFTVQDHLKSASAKVGVSGRGELTAALLLDGAPTLTLVGQRSKERAITSRCT